MDLEIKKKLEKALSFDSASFPTRAREIVRSLNSYFKKKKTLTLSQQILLDNLLRDISGKWKQQTRTAGLN